MVNIIGAGLAGTECAYILANNGIKVNLYDMKPLKKSEAHESDDFAELVCSNSLKSSALTNACGLLKKEMELLGSLMIKAAEYSKIPAGQALAVNREEFSLYITNKIRENEKITIINKEIQDIRELEGITVIATGPLTSEDLLKSIKSKVGDEGLYFYDAAAPIIEYESIDKNKVYRMDRYGEIGIGDYLNLAMTKNEYYIFYNELINARSAPRHDYDKLVLFEGCMPIEEMAKRGEKTLTFGPLKPVGLKNPVLEEKPYAVVQLRAENKEKTIYNMVGFQTSLTFGEQKRVFSLIPGLENAVFVRYGVMHKNSFINSSKLLDSNFCLIEDNDVYFAGQISGVEGYVESAASGMMVAYSIIKRLEGEKIEFPEETMLGSLAKHISTENKDFQPMNANFGILKPLKDTIRDKKERYTKLAERSILSINKFKETL